jgi:diguanylate cyclase (GGDEF)-like protein
MLKGINKGRIRDPLIAQEEANTILESVTAKPDAYKVLQARSRDYILTAQASKSEENRKKVEIDELTQLPNQKGTIRRVEEAIARHNRLRTRYQILFMDIDGFKKFNDTYGHPEGNILLQDFARLIKHQVRAYEDAGRYGGDEFVLILESPNPKEAQRITKSIADHLTELSLVSRRYNKLAVSIGVRTIEPDEHIDAETALRQADAAMYNAKKRHGTVLVPWKRGMKIHKESSFNT